MSEWNAQLAAGLAQNLGSALEVWAPDFWQLFRMAEGEHKAAESLRALLAQRDGELEALREKVAKVSAMHEPRPKSSRDIGRLPWGCSCGTHYWPCPTVAALSDNQEGR